MLALLGVLDTGNTKQPSDRVEAVSEDGLQSQLGVVDVEVATPPGQETVDQADDSEDAKNRSNDGTGNLDTQESTVGESVQSVLSLFLGLLGNDDTTSGEGFLDLGVTQLRDGQRGGNGHDAGGNENLGVQAQQDVTSQNGTGDGSETASHDLVQLGLGHVRNEGADQHGRFTLTNEGRSSSDDGLGTGDTKSPEDKGGHLADEPLQEANVVEDLDNGDEEDDGGNDTPEEHGQLRCLLVGQEGHTITGKTQEVAGASRNPLEDIQTDLGAQHEQTNDVLRQHTNDDGVPVDTATVLASRPEAEEDNSQTKQADGTVLAGVVGALLRDEGANKDNGDGTGGADKGTELGRNKLDNLDDGTLPNPTNGLGGVAAGDVVGDQADHDSQPQQEGHNPVLVLSVQDERGDPPAGEEAEDEEVDERTAVAVDGTELGPAARRRRRVGALGMLRLGVDLAVGAHHTGLLVLIVVALVLGRGLGLGAGHAVNLMLVALHQVGSDVGRNHGVGGQVAVAGRGRVVGVVVGHCGRRDTLSGAKSRADQGQIN